MTEMIEAAPGAEVTHVDLTGSTFLKVHLNDARFRLVDMSGVVMRDVSLAAASIDGAEIDGLRVDGVEVAPLIEAELVRREPARALRRASDPAGLREAWAALTQSWDAARARLAALPSGSADISVEHEWSFAQTLRHLVFVTDAWLGTLLGDEQQYHPWGLPFADVGEFVDPATLGVDIGATPSYADVLDVRAHRVASVGEFLRTLTPDGLAEQCAGPAWHQGELSVLHCLWVVLAEECHHLGFAKRDLAVLEGRSAASV